MKLPFVLFCLILFCSCASEKTSSSIDHSLSYASSLDVEGKYLECSVFNDDTLHGKLNLIKIDEDTSCIDVRILKYSNNLFKTENTFMQFYPMSVRKGKVRNGESLSILTYNKDQPDNPLIQSKIIDSYLIEKRIQTPKSRFFQKHFLRLCGLEDDWDALKIVIYLRGKNSEPAIIRMTTALIPPFLSHPNDFKDKNDEALFVYHPFYAVTNDLQIAPSSYYTLSKSICSQ